MTDKTMTVGEVMLLIQNIPDNMEILTINPEKSLVYSRIKKVVMQEHQHPKDSWLTFVLEEV